MRDCNASFGDAKQLLMFSTTGSPEYRLNVDSAWTSAEVYENIDDLMQAIELEWGYLDGLGAMYPGEAPESDMTIFEGGQYWRFPNQEAP